MFIIYNKLLFNMLFQFITEKKHTLDAFISMDSSDEFGEVMDLEKFKSRFS